MHALYFSPLQRSLNATARQLYSPAHEDRQNDEVKCIQSNELFWVCTGGKSAPWS